MSQFYITSSLDGEFPGNESCVFVLKPKCMYATIFLLHRLEDSCSYLGLPRGREAGRGGAAGRERKGETNE